jgi:quercetin dioxygenase-like cupin family protein
VTYRIFDASEIDERRKPVAAELGALAIKVNQFDSQPDQAGKEHDETHSGQEEIYIPVRGSGVLRVDGDEVPLEPGRFVLVPPEPTRQVVAGPDGLSYVVVGAVVVD